MAAFKAPSVSGLNALFFQNQWDVVEPTICQFVKHIFSHPEEVKDIKKILVVLIPKVDFEKSV